MQQRYACGGGPEPQPVEPDPSNGGKMVQEGTQDNYQVMFGNLKVGFDDLLKQMAEANAALMQNMQTGMANLTNQAQVQNNIINQHLQNSVTAADQINKVTITHLSRVMSDDARLAREVEVAESVANAIIGTVAKEGTVDYVAFLAAVIEALRTTREPKAATS